MKTSRAGVATALALVAGCAWAKDEPQGSPQVEAGQEFKVEPARLSLRVDAMAWYMGPGGDLDLPSTDSLGDPEPFTIDGLGYDTPRFVAAPEFNITWSDVWRVTARGYYFSDDHDRVMSTSGRIGRVGFGAGDTLHSAMSFGSYEVEVAHKWFDYPDQLAAVPDRDFFGTVEFVGGVRVFQLGWDVARTSGGPFPGDTAQNAEETFVQPMIGGRLRCDFTRDAGLDAQIDLGMLPLGDGSNASADVIVGGWWYPWTNVGVQIGYRAAYFSLGTGTGVDDFDFTGWNQGLQFGVVIQF